MRECNCNRWRGLVFLGSNQLGFGVYKQAMAKKRNRRERFLAEMEKVVPWKALIDLIEPHYPKTSSNGGWLQRVQSWSSA